MAHRITLIITEDNISIPEEIPHFYDKGYLVIPTDDDGWETEMIQKICETEDSFEKVFKLFFEELWNEELNNGEFEDVYSEVGKLDSLYMLELIEKLNISNFIIYHYTELALEMFENYIAFENRKYINEPQSWTKFCNTKINSYDYWRYDSCKKKYLERLDK